MKEPNITNALRNIAILSDLLPLILFLFFARSKKDIGLRVAFLLSAYGLLVNFFVFTNSHLRDHSFLVSRISTIIEFSLYSFFFFKIIRSRVFKTGIIIASASMALLFVYFLFVNSSNSFDSFPSGLSTLIFFIFSIFFLFEKIKNEPSLFLYTSPSFWVVVAVIIYSAGTFFPFIYAQGNTNKPEFRYEFVLIHSTLYILKNLLICVAMLTREKFTNSSDTFPSKRKIISSPNQR